MNTHGLDQASRWWWDNAVEQIRNLTVARGKLAPFEVWFDDPRDAEIVAMFLRPYLMGIMDWQEINWLVLVQAPARCPDLL